MSKTVSGVQQISVNDLATASPGLYQISIADLAAAIENQVIVFYDNNRGQMGLSQRRVDKMSENLHPESLGMISIGMYKGKLTIADAHHRCVSIQLAIQNNKISPSERKYLVAIKILKISSPEDFLQAYADLNNCYKHTTNQDVTNPDFRYGDVIQNQIKPVLEGFGYKKDYLDNVFANKRSANLSYVIDALNLNLSQA